MSAVPTKKSKDDFHRERSRFLDAFAALEEALADRSLPPEDSQTANLLKALRGIRNDLVHSQLRFANIDGELQAVVINVQDMKKAARPSRLGAFGDFQKVGSQLGLVRKALA